MSTKVTRRKFLKILGTATAAGAAGCADSARQNILPFAKGDETQVPGEAVWFRSTCTECSAGCGIQVRTREGRAVKIEGSPDNPINQGGLCAIGQSSLQHLYDPDRVRQPLKDSKPVAWDAALADVAGALQKKDGRNIFVTGSLSGAEATLVKDFCKKNDITHLTWDVSAPVALAKASELSFGSYGVPEYKFDKADVVLNFGADFLETWVSPCGYARDWARSRRSKHPARVIHVEPRLSLTGANADHWFSAQPGTEVLLALAILQDLVEKGFGKDLNSTTLSRIKKLVSDVDIDKVATETGIAKEKILLIAHYLEEAHGSLVTAGGAAASTNDPLPLMVVTNLINLVLGNVGKTILLDRLRRPESSLDELQKILNAVNKGEGKPLNAVFVYGTNPEFTLPASFGWRYALKKARSVISFSSHMDETTKLAGHVLPSHTPLESWGDQRPMDGVYNLLQPVMKPVFDTRQFGDLLLNLGKESGVGEGAATFEEYLKKSWEQIYEAEGRPGQSFSRFWLQSVEQGGYFKGKVGQSTEVITNGKAFDLNFTAVKFDPGVEKKQKASSNDLVLFPYPSVKSFDGSSANRPWIQELPDPITQVVWDSWAEIHPDTAKAHGLEQGDVVSVSNYYGQLEVPIYVTDYVHRNVVAVPLGEGHTDYGRYADKVGGGNVFNLLPLGTAANSLPLVSSKVSVKRGRSRQELVVVQGSNSQGDRHLAQTKYLDQKHDHDHDQDHGDGHHGGHHEPAQMYEQRKAPVYEWGLNVDLAACTGCSACVVACYAENNIPVVGKTVAGQGREMSWLRIERYYEGPAEELEVSFLPMMCQHCGNAPCEPVCPVYATYHTEQGLNAMIYNRCVGTRYCANNCSYKVRRFNWYEYDWPEPLNMQLNPDVMKRTAGIMEKCSFCVQRIAEGVDKAKDAGRLVKDGEIKPACVQSCPTQALTFGNLEDHKSKVYKLSKKDRAYKVLDHHLNTQPAVSYLKNKKYKV